MIKTYGTDIEYILINKSGQYASAVGLLGGSKEDPVLVDGGNIQEDNILAEVATDICHSEDEFVNNIRRVNRSLMTVLQPLGLHAHALASARVPDEILCTPQALIFGCDPDINAYTGKINPSPTPQAVGNLRTAGAHLHLGVEKWDEELVKWLDVTLGLFSVIADKDKDRRTVYGGAGAYRSKPYGLEYRVLSNFWVNSEAYVRDVFRRANVAYDIYASGKKVSDYVSENMIRACINGQISPRAVKQLNGVLIKKGAFNGTEGPQ